MSSNPPRHSLTKDLVLNCPSSRHGLDEIANKLAQSKSVVMIAGAGISTAAGIPDYRSRCGLYAKGDIFTEGAFRDAKLRASVQKRVWKLRRQAKASEPTKTHHFIVRMRDNRKLRRCYTQNIDMLETKAGLETNLDAASVDCVQLHGSLELLRCSICSSTCPTEDHDARISTGEDVPCPKCTGRSRAREEVGKRRLRVGLLLPDIVRIEQHDHPQGEAIGELVDKDNSAGPDFLLILGTSLKVYGSKRIAKQFARTVQGKGGMVVYVNMSKPPADLRGSIHYWVKSKCDAWVDDVKLCWSARGRMGVAPTVIAGSSFESPIVLD